MSRGTYSQYLRNERKKRQAMIRKGQMPPHPFAFFGFIKIVPTASGLTPAEIAALKFRSLDAWGFYDKHPELRETILTAWYRRCNVCGQDLWMTKMFSPNPSRGTGYDYMCKDCGAARRKSARARRFRQKKQTQRMPDTHFNGLYTSLALRAQVGKIAKRYAKRRRHLQEDFAQEAWSRIAFSPVGLSFSQYAEIARKAIEAAYRRDYRRRPHNMNIHSRRNRNQRGRR